MRLNVLALLVSAFVAWFGCGDNLHVTSTTLVSVTVAPSSPSLSVGDQVQLTATAMFSDGTTLDVTSDASWAASNTATITVNADGTPGLMRAVMGGTSEVTASYESATGNVTISVTAAEVASLGLTPPTANMPKGTTLDVIATAVFTDGTTGTVNNAATWSSSDEAVATVSSLGTVTAVDVGTATITATVNGISASMTVTVTSATLVSIEVTPTTPSIASGTTIDFTATGIYTDGSQQTLTTQVMWSSSTAAATISNDLGSEGVATGAQAGTTTITATLTASNISGSTTLEVTAATLTSIQIDPLDPTMPVGTSQPFTATGIYSDSSTQDITSQVTWSGDNDTAASVASDGTVTANNPGMATITATDPTTNISGTSIVTVSGVVLTAITILPTDPSVAKGTSLSFTAEGLYSDLSTRDITAEVTWGSSDTNTAQISNAPGSEGFAVTLAVGSTTISATDPTTNVTASTTLTVTTAVLVRIDVDPANETLPRGSGELYTATGVYSDFTTQDLTTSVTWSSSNTNAATISNAAGSEGLVTTLAAGTTTITALDVASGVSGSAKLVVGTSVLLDITISPLNPVIAKGGRIQFRCVGTYDDGTFRDITQFVTWSSSKLGTASISNAPKKRGLAQGKNPGMATITCTDPGTGISASTILTVTNATLSSITISPVDATTPAGTHVYYTAVGHYSDNTTSDFTSSVSWSSSDTSVATISNQTFLWGTATAVAPGTTSITALDVASGISATVPLTVSDATLVSLTISPSDPTIIVNTQTQMTATGMFSDGSTVDVTRDVTWTSSATNVATVLNVGVTKGTVTGVSAGQTTLTANYPLTVTSATTTVTVIL